MKRPEFEVLSNKEAIQKKNEETRKIIDEIIKIHSIDENEDPLAFTREIITTFIRIYFVDLILLHKSHGGADECIMHDIKKSIEVFLDEIDKSILLGSDFYKKFKDNLS